MYRVILYGIGSDYDLIINQVLFEIKKGNISVEGIFCEENDQYCLYKDGFNVHKKQDIPNFKFDYVIITESRFFYAIKRDIMALGVEDNKIINGGIFSFPLFDFKSYTMLIENPVTIISDDCWAGFAYNRLGLPFATPFINTLIDRDDFIKLIKSPKEFLSSELLPIDEGDLIKGRMPIGKLCNEKDSINIKFPHSCNFGQAKDDWEKRVKRINYNNIFIKLGIPSNIEETKVSLYLSEIKKINFKKIVFYYGNTDEDFVFKTDRFFWFQINQGRIDDYNYSNNFLTKNYTEDLNLLKLLTEGKGASRYYNNEN